MIEICGIEGIGEVEPGSDVAALIADALERGNIPTSPSDILVITQKVVSKAEGRFVDLRAVEPGSEALRLAQITRKDARLVEVVLSESSAVIRAAPNVLIARHRLGLVMANAGVDRSNIGSRDDTRVLLLPKDPDASAQSIRAALARRFGHEMGVVISDSFGRPWRQGVVNVAIGAAGVASLIDRRGERDRDGRVLEVTQVALADMLATAAALATGEGAEGIPAAIIRGAASSRGPSPAAALVRPLEEDLFR